MNNELKELKLKAKDKAHRLLEGNHISKSKGDGYNFYELREYQIGDDINKINWIASAKLNETYVKETHSNKEISIVVANMLDGSLYFGQGNKKQQKITEISAILSYATLLGGDSFQGVSISEHKTYITPSTKDIYFIDDFINHTNNVNTLNTKLNYTKALHDLSNQLNKSSLLFIISDFLNPIDLSILSIKHDTVAIIVRDENEESLDYLGETTLINPYNNESSSLYVSKSSIKEYIKNVKKHDEELYAHFQSHNVRYTKILTSDSSVQKLRELFS